MHTHRLFGGLSVLLLVSASTVACATPAEDDGETSIDAFTAPPGYVAGSLESSTCPRNPGASTPFACIATVRDDTGRAIALLGEGSVDSERKLSLYAGKQVQLRTSGVVPSERSGLLRGVDYDAAYAWGGVVQRRGAPARSDIQCHVDLQSEAARKITLTFQVEREDASTSSGPKHEDYAINGELSIESPDLAPTRDRVTADVRAYCVSGRLSRDAAYSPAGRRCEDRDILGLSLQPDGRGIGRFSAHVPRGMVFERVDAAASTSEHVLYEVEVRVNDAPERDPVGQRGSFRFDFEPAFTGQGGTCI